MSIQTMPPRLSAIQSAPVRFAAANGPDKPEDSKKPEDKKPPQAPPVGLGNLFSTLLTAVTKGIGSIIEKSASLLGQERFTKLAVLNEVSQKAGVFPHTQLLQTLGEQLGKSVQDPKQLLDLKTVDQLISAAEGKLKAAVDEKQGAGSFDKLYKEAEEGLKKK